MSCKNQSDLYLEDNISKYTAIELLEKLGYTYISPDDCKKQRQGERDVLLIDILREQLEKINEYEYGGKKLKFTNDNIHRAIRDLDETMVDGLPKSSERVYNALMLGKSYPELLNDGKILSFDLKYIDWENFDNNVFHVTEEFAVNSETNQFNARPDIVLFINGIPFGVIENKAPTVEVQQAISQMIRNQNKVYIPQLFKFVQIVMASNVNEVKYATATTPEKFWSVWHEQNTDFLESELSRCVAGREPTVQDRNIISLFSLERVKDLIQFFVFYDGNVKKICRYQQYFAIKEIIKTINQDDASGNRQGGVVWHTQGSGKSLTMVMIAKYILTTMHKLNPKVVIVTDRKELDKQIAKTFSHTKLRPARATSGKNLVDLISENKVDVVTTVINKFNTVVNSKTKIENRDVFVFIDESHRTQYGELATKMRIVFPNACYIGFTGTPLLKTEKNTMLKFGKLIHKYTIEDGVNDGAIVPLIYEGRFVEQKVDEQNIDLWFEQTTRRLTEAQKLDLKNRWSTIKRLSSTDRRIERIALDINNHFVEGFENSGFKAMLACNSKKDAIRYKKYFDAMGDLKTEVVISPPDTREGYTDIDESSDDEVVSFWNKEMKKYSNEDDYEDTIKNRFIDGEIDILIVCSKLLTGFDAPLTQILYIDKELKEHNLLQAIARTNRLSEGKDFGLIVDYRGLINELDDAMNMYSGSGLELFDPEDIKGTVVDVMSVVGEIREKHSQLLSLFDSVKDKNDTELIEQALADEENRKNFYFLLCEFGKRLNIVLNSVRAFEAFSQNEINKFKSDFTFFSKVRRSIKIRYGDAIDNKEYEPQMQQLLDKYMSVEGLKQITNPVDILDKDDFEKEIEQLVSDRAKAEAIVHNMAKSISQKRDENPAYYDSFSKRIKDTLKEYNDRVISEAEYYAKMKSIMDDYAANKSTVSYPEKIKSNVHAQAFYGVVCAIIDDEKVVVSTDVVADIAVRITEIVEEHNTVDWHDNVEVHKRIAQDIDDMFFDLEQESVIKLSFDAIDKIIENVKTVALRRF